MQPYVNVINVWMSSLNQEPADDQMQSTCPVI